MQNFMFNLPTKVYFGEGQIKHLPDILKEYGTRVLLAYGGGSIKKNGIYDKVVSLLTAGGFTYYELSGIEPNPKVETVEEGIRLCREKKIDILLPVGGGSTIDCCKIIAAGYFYDGPVWDLVVTPKLLQKALPLVTVLTHAATGSEMNPNGVIVNTKINAKAGTGNIHTVPKASIMDPTYTFSVPALQTAAGVADIMSHTMENYFKKEKGAYLQDCTSEGILKTCIKYGPIAIKEPDNYEARANIMWASSWAINGFTASGKPGAWSCHPMEHQIGGTYDTTHGIGLAILTPRWMKYVLNEDTVDKFVEFAKNVWGLDTSGDKFKIANKAIDKTYEFFESMGIPMFLKDIGVEEDSIEQMAKGAIAYKGGLKGTYIELTKEDIVNIYKSSL